MSKQTTFDNAVIPLAPIWDSINDLTRLRGITAALAYLTSPAHLKEDDEYALFHESLMDIHERLDAACDALTAARREVKFIPEKTT